MVELEEKAAYVSIGLGFQKTRHVLAIVDTLAWLGESVVSSSKVEDLEFGEGRLGGRRCHVQLSVMFKVDAV